MKDEMGGVCTLTSDGKMRNGFKMIDTQAYQHGNFKCYMDLT
jgi:hypothetical protein